MANEKRLIDANALLGRFRVVAQSGGAVTYHVSDICAAIEDEAIEAPVDAVVVVHARWEKASETMPIYRCSVCKERNLFKNGYNVLSNYCPNCGAKMDGERKAEGK